MTRFVVMTESMPPREELHMHRQTHGEGDGEVLVEAGREQLGGEGEKEGGGK